MSDFFKKLGWEPDQVAEFWRKIQDHVSTVNFIVATLLAEHRGKWLFFDHVSGDFEIIGSQIEAMQKLAERGPNVSVCLIEDRGLQNTPPTVQ